MDKRYDVVIVGGGAAGLAAAVTLARARRAVLVIDSGAPRNAPAGHIHNYLGREGSAPADLLADGRADAIGYGAEVLAGTAVSAEREPHGFRILLDDGSAVLARRLLVTTGLVDELPDIPGLESRWGREVLHCPYCHGWEVREQRIGVLGTGPLAVHQALMWRQWCEDVTLFLRAELGAEDAESLAARGITVERGAVAGLALTVDDGGAERFDGVRLEDGTVVPVQAVVVASTMVARADVLTSLGLEPVELEMGGHVIGSAVPADAMGTTAVPGVWVAGNVTDLKSQLIIAAGAGLTAATAINADLSAEDTRLAVAAHRS
ncbi:NAD(P)/FAD-dependent oxidoreductase [Tomitella biformata]|uniref:NAD(P)/FAD-dependent oxidoreductase n=1 Tax=Tomitella biformata TaxID=630403 RepID=UPI000465C594|nr:NAD(P)/FAD-dependent oxidoreductase [Tomitella biformata]